MGAEFRFARFTRIARNAIVMTMLTSTDTPTQRKAKTRGARLEARISSEQKAMLQYAAELSSRTVSEFVVASAQEAAAKIIQAHETIRLTKAEQIAFVTALLDPPAPGPRLKQAAAWYRAQVGL